ncbi:MAG: recombinase family protein, partial [Lentilitoribacter sp.]
MTQKALIYCRVSSKRQATDGSGLTSQEKRCRLHASQKGYEIDGVFPDDITGGGDFMKRPGMVAMLGYLKA